MIRGADGVETTGRQHITSRYRERRNDPAWSKTLRTYGSLPHGNREISRLTSFGWLRGSHGESQGNTVVMNEREKSDRPIVPRKLPNKGG